MTKKIELDSATIDKIAHLTNNNHHTHARFALAQAMESKKLVIVYKAIIIDLERFHYQGQYMDYLSPLGDTIDTDLSTLQDTVDKVLFASAKKMYSNFDEIWDSF